MRFFLIDRVDVLLPGQSATGIKCLTLTDEIFFDHFPGFPSYPGSLLTESMAQLAGFLAEVSYHAQYPDTRRAVLAQVDRAKFHRGCRPGDQLIVTARLTSLLSAAAQFECHIESGTYEMATAVLTFRLLQVEKPQLHSHRIELYKLWTAHMNPPPQLR